MKDAKHLEPSWMIESKFEPSRPSVDLVRRERLLRILQEGASKKLVLVVAPAGYGKSSLLGQWVGEERQMPLQCGWLTLDAAETDEKQFLAYLVLALSDAGIELDDLAIGARNGFSDSDIEAILSKITISLNNIEHASTLILEDYHNAECEAVNAIINRLLRDVTTDFTLVIDSRRQPDIDAFSLIASGDALEINAVQLRLTEEETLAALDNVTDESDSLEVYRRTEGWPVAVQLARVQKRRSPDEPILAGVDGGLIASYLTEQILSSLDEETQEFLLAVSFLDRFNPDLTNFVLDQPNAWGRIDALSSLAALFVLLDQEGSWYRLHHLFAEYLRELQLRRDQSAASAYLLRASEWYLSQRDTVRAVRYAAEAKDFENCEEIIRDAGGWSIILTEGIGVLRTTLRFMPSQYEKESPTLLIARAYLHCKDGKIQEARATLNASLPLIEISNDERLVIDRLLVEGLINNYEDREDWTPSFDTVRKRYKDGKGLTALEYGTIKCEDVIVLMSIADMDASISALREAFSKMRESGSVLGLNYCYVHAGHLALHRADFEVAAANIDRALEMAEENFGSDSGLKNVALVLHYALMVWQGRAGRAEMDGLQKSLFNTIEYDGWVELYLTGLEAAVLLARQCGDDQYGLTLINHVLAFSKERGLLRLENFASLLRLHFPSQRGLGPGSDIALERFLSPQSVSQSPRQWQLFVEAAARSIVDQRSDEANENIENMLSFASVRNAHLKSLLLETARAGASLKTGADDLLRTIKLASSQRILGLFLADSTIIAALQKERPSLRHNEEELLTLKFVDEVLERAKVLNPRRENDVLSDREYDVLLQLAVGQTNKEIARALELTENTVKFHLKNLYTKLSVNKRTQAIIEAQKRGLLD